MSGPPIGVEPRKAIVHSDMTRPRISAALATPAQHVAMVASRRKAQTLTSRLQAEGVPAERLAQLRAPAGLDLGGIDPEEIAVSIVAEMIQIRSQTRSAQVSQR